MIPPPPPGSIGKILVRGVNWIGDTILTMPALEGLSRLLPLLPAQSFDYTLVSRDTVEQDFALRRQLFLCEQGYTYEIQDADETSGWTSGTKNWART